MAVSTRAAVLTPGRRLPGLRVLWRFPIIPVFFLSLLVITGVFAPLVAPYDPKMGSLRDQSLPPVWVGDQTSLKSVVQKVDIGREAGQITLNAAQKINPIAAIGDQVEAVTKPGGSTAHLLGTDQQGRDILSRIIFGARITLILVTVTLVIGGAIGTLLGLISGWYGGLVDELIMRLVDIKLSIPLVLLALVFVLTFGQSFKIIVIILVLNIWTRFARQIRGEVLQLKNMDYVAMAKVTGASTPRILMKHIFPGTLNTLIVIATLQVGFVILVEAVLSFLGAGVPPPTPAWGSMVADGRDYLAVAWWISTVPGLAILFTVMSLNLFGDWLRDRLDPRLRQLE